MNSLQRCAGVAGLTPSLGKWASTINVLHLPLGLVWDRNMGYDVTKQRKVPTCSYLILHLAGSG